MSARRRPTIKTRCVASRYARDGERIAEFSATRNGELFGGLISLVMRDDGLHVRLYRLDQHVHVTVELHKAD